MDFRVVVVRSKSESIGLVMTAQFGFRWVVTLHREVIVWLEERCFVGGANLGVVWFEMVVVWLEVRWL